jgi:glycerol-3-phosphate acyltransferase PlsY
VTTQAWAVLLGAYLLGSIPSAYLAARLVARIDILQVGDGNMGAKNTFESVGWLPGIVVGVADVCKGALAVLMARQFHLPENVVLWSGACVVLGHDFSIFLRFRGGQGMAAMIGVFGVLFPREMGIALLVLAAVLLITHNWDLSCAIAFSLLPILLGFFRRPTKRVLYPVLMLPTIGLKKLIAVWQSRHATA